MSFYPIFDIFRLSWIKFTYDMPKKPLKECVMKICACRAVPFLTGTNKSTYTRIIVKPFHQTGCHIMT